MPAMLLALREMGTGCCFGQWCPPHPPSPDPSPSALDEPASTKFHRSYTIAAGAPQPASEPVTSSISASLPPAIPISGAVPYPPVEFHRSYAARAGIRLEPSTSSISGPALQPLAPGATQSVLEPQSRCRSSPRPSFPAPALDRPSDGKMVTLLCTETAAWTVAGSAATTSCRLCAGGV